MARRFLIITMFFLFVLIPNSKALSSVPTTENLELQSAIKDYNAENYEEAIASLEKFRAANPSDPLSAYYLGLTYKKTLDFKSSIKNLKDALSLDGSITEAVAELAEVSFQAGLDDEALKYIKQMEAGGVEPAIAAFLHGMVSLRQGRNSEAIEYFKLAASLDSDLSQSTKYQIGVAHMREGELKDAAKVLGEAIELDPETNLAINALEYLKKRREKKKKESRFGVYANFGFDFDDNVILEPIGQPVALGISNKKDRVMFANLYVDYAAFYRGPLSIRGRYGLSVSRHDTNKQYDHTNHVFSIIPTFKIENNFVNIPMTQSFTLLDKKDYLRSFSIAPAYFHKLPKSFVAASIRFTTKDFVQAPLLIENDRDAKFFAGSFRWIKFLMDNKAMVDIKYEISREETDGSNWSYNGHGVYFSSTLPIAQKLKLNIAGNILAQRFDNIDSVYLEKREDDSYSLSASLSYGLFDEVSFQFRAKYIRNKSNISVYDYKRSKVGLSLEYRY